MQARPCFDVPILMELGSSAARLVHDRRSASIQRWHRNDSAGGGHATEQAPGPGATTPVAPK